MVSALRKSKRISLENREASQKDVEGGGILASAMKLAGSLFKSSYPTRHSKALTSEPEELPDSTAPASPTSNFSAEEEVAAAPARNTRSHSIGKPATVSAAFPSTRARTLRPKPATSPQFQTVPGEDDVVNDPLVLELEPYKASLKRAAENTPPALGPDGNPLVKRKRGRPPRDKSQVLAEVPQNDANHAASLHVVPKKETMCCHCFTTHSSCWRKGPEEYPTLCNTCGVQYFRGTLNNQNPPRLSIKIPGGIKATEPSPRNPTDFMDDDDADLSLFCDANQLSAGKAAASLTSPFDHSYISDFDAPLPKKYLFPSIKPESLFDDPSYIYPSPYALTDTEDRVDYLISRLEMMDPCQIAQVLCVLDSDSRREFDRALQVRRDASLDVSALSDTTWSLLCSIFEHH
ncbi:hypothetical protein HDV03_002964 [Kappamyces sp. JEL0829]|nr:hypothetical protein HDV03_002964 [Kappamyces sp. JEL0829]KAJ3347762.1 hypothetical protein HDU91_006706 [Kappamyces sp. JEL0680]